MGSWRPLPTLLDGGLGHLQLRGDLLAVQSCLEQPPAREGLLEQRRLEHSIEQRGILQPVLVDPRDGGDYVLVDGHRRIQAAAKIGLMEIPISIRQSQDEGDNLIDAVVANQLHAHLNLLDGIDLSARIETVLDHDVCQRNRADRRGTRHATCLAVGHFAFPFNKAAPPGAGPIPNPTHA